MGGVEGVWGFCCFKSKIRLNLNLPQSFPPNLSNILYSSILGHLLFLFMHENPTPVYFFFMSQID